MKLCTSPVIKSLLACFILFGLSNCVVYSQNSGSNPIRSTNASIVLTPEPIEGRDVRNVNGNIIVGTGMTVNDVDSVNGRVIVQDGASARNIETVNGRVVIEGSEATVQDIETVNGRINAISGGNIRGNAETVNGRINLANVTVGRNLKTANGNITLFDVTVGESIETRNGDVRLENSIVERDLILKKRRISGLWDIFNWDWNDQEVIIGPGSEIKGNLIANDEIQLYVHESASVNNIVGAIALPYSGSRPPRH